MVLDESLSADSTTTVFPGGRERQPDRAGRYPISDNNVAARFVCRGLFAGRMEDRAQSDAELRRAV